MLTCQYNLHANVQNVNINYEVGEVLQARTARQEIASDGDVIMVGGAVVASGL